MSGLGGCILGLFAIGALFASIALIGLVIAGIVRLIRWIICVVSGVEFSIEYDREYIRSQQE